MKNKKSKDDEYLQFMQARYPAPICNHTAEIDRNNIGYTTGVCIGGIPFEAEKWTNDEITALTVVMPNWIADADDELTETAEKNAESGEPSHEYIQSDDNSVLPIGMVECGQETDIDIVMLYVYFLVKRGIVQFTGEYYNGSVRYLVDVEGNNLAWVTITLQENGEVCATTPLKFEPFPNMPKLAPILKVVHGSGLIS